MNCSNKPVRCAIFTFAVLLMLISACQNGPTNDKRPDSQNNQQTDVEDVSSGIRLYVLHVDTGTFIKNLIFKSPKDDTTRRLVFKIRLFADSGHQKLTMGIWAGKNKHQFIKKTPGVILDIGIQYDTTVVDPFFIGDLQIKRGEIMKFIKDNKGRYLIFVPEVINKNSHKYLIYWIYNSNSLDKADFLKFLAPIKLDPSPPADALEESNP